MQHIRTRYDRSSISLISQDKVMIINPRHASVFSDHNNFVVSEFALGLSFCETSFSDRKVLGIYAAFRKNTISI